MVSQRTLLDLLSLPIPEDVQGHSLAGVLACTSCELPGFQFMLGMGAVAAWGDGHEWRALRTNRFTYAKYLSDGMELLFDNLDDPWQMRNLANDPGYSGILSDLKREMAGEMARIHDEFWPASYYKHNWIQDRHIMRTATESYEKPIHNPSIPRGIPRPEYPRPQFVRAE